MTALTAEPFVDRVESLRRLRRLVSPYVGIVRDVGELMRMPDDARLVRVGCRLADSLATVGARLEVHPGGSGTSRDEALAAALGETAERYSGTFVAECDLVLGTASELGPEAVDPARFALHSPAQYAQPGFPFRPFTRETQVRWVRGFRLPDGEPALLPHQLVSLRFRHAAELGETAIGYTTSNGLACGATLEEAVLAGLLELTERDAFMIVWANRLSLPRLDWSAHAELAAHDARYLAPSGLARAAIDLSAFMDVPTVLGVVRAGAVAVGAASAPTVEAAWRRALAEAFAVHAWGRALAAEGRCSRRDDFADVERFDDHVRLYTDPRFAVHADFLDDADESRDIRSIPPLEGGTPLGLIEALTGRLAARGVVAYCVEVTAPDVRAAGLRVAKVVAPELCALDAAHQGRFLGGRRLYEEAHALGLRAEPLAPDDVNPYPHPFP
jgi:ribosomal protein S12 methylthiotransferase accessory factor